MTNRLLSLALVVATIAIQSIPTSPAMAGGISIDSGLTPAQGRVILRTRLAYLRRATSWSSAPPSMEMFMVPFVAAWGVLPELTVMARTSAVHSQMSMAGDGMMAGGESSETGMGDLLLQAKYKLYRWNSRNLVMGVAPTLGLEAPTGLNGFSSDTWDLRAGLHFTHRWRRLNADLTAAYVWNGLAGVDSDSGDPADELQLTLAFSRMFRLPGASSLALSPVLELSTSWTGVEGKGGADGAEAVVYVSPGMLFVTRWVIFEALAQVPVWQQNPTGILERSIGLIMGVRFLL